MIRPEKFPNWCMKNNNNGENNSPTKKEYPQEKIDDGWDIDEVPPREWENYYKNLNALWLHYFDEQIQKISTVGVPIGVALPTFPSLGGYKCVALEVADNFGFVLCNGQKINDPTSPFNNKIIPNLNGNNFLKGSVADNVVGGNKDNKINFDHTHNYAHTHQVSNLAIKFNSSQKVLEQYFFKNPSKSEQPNPDFLLQYSGIPSSGNSGDVMRLITSSTQLTALFTSGVYGDSVNDILDKAETSKAVGRSTLNIEPQNISTVYIIRIK